MLAAHSRIGAAMNKRILIVHAHPEPASLNGALKDAMHAQIYL